MQLVVIVVSLIALMGGLLFDASRFASQRAQKAIMLARLNELLRGELTEKSVMRTVFGRIVQVTGE